MLTCCAFLPDGRRIIAGTNNGELKVHDAASAEVGEDFIDAHSAPVTSLRAHPGLLAGKQSGRRS